MPLIRFIKQAAFCKLMQFEADKTERWGRYAGYLAAYFAATTMLYLVLFLFERTSSYFHLMLLVLAIVSAGELVKWWLQ